jgi:hypothetical protein
VVADRVGAELVVAALHEVARQAGADARLEVAVTSPSCRRRCPGIPWSPCSRPLDASTPRGLPPRWPTMSLACAGVRTISCRKHLIKGAAGRRPRRPGARHAAVSGSGCSARRAARGGGGRGPRGRRARGGRHRGGGGGDLARTRRAVAVAVFVLEAAVPSSPVVVVALAGVLAGGHRPQLGRGGAGRRGRRARRSRRPRRPGARHAAMNGGERLEVVADRGGGGGDLARTRRAVAVAVVVLEAAVPSSPGWWSRWPACSRWSRLGG